jgi:hypothetical protein
MNQFENSDNDDFQAFIINDECIESSNRTESTKFNHKFSENGSWSLIKFLGIGFLALIAVSSLAKSYDSNSGKVGTFFGFFFVAISLFLYFLFNSAKKYKSDLEKETSSIRNRSYDIKSNRRLSKSNSKHKKFNTIQEHKAYQEAVLGVEKTQEHNSNNAEEIQCFEKQRSENIELAVKALISLGFKIKRANDLVSRGIDSGIPVEDTQMLIKYALNNNNKA